MPSVNAQRVDSRTKERFSRVMNRAPRVTASHLGLVSFRASPTAQLLDPGAIRDAFKPTASCSTPCIRLIGFDGFGSGNQVSGTGDTGGNFFGHPVFFDEFE